MGLTLFSLQLLLNSFVFGISLILNVLETTFRYITNGDTAELVTNEVINKETLGRVEEFMQYFKGHKFVLLKVYNFIEAGLDNIFPIRFEQRRVEVDSNGKVFFTQMQFHLRFALIFCVDIL